MNPNSKKPGYLFFTPRTPWGTRAGQQSFRHHQRASEDRKPDPTSKEMQGLGGQMAPNQLTGAGGQPEKTDSSVWKVPHSNLQPYHPQPVPQPTSPTAQQLATQGPLASTQQQWRQADPVTFGKDEPETHVEGAISGEADGRFKEGSIEGEAGVSLPRSMYTGPTDYIPRGKPPPTKKPSGKPLKVIDKRVPPLNQDPEDYPRKQE